MPHYEFFCHACKKSFSKEMSLADYGKRKLTCPHCGSHKVEQRWSAFSVLTSKKSAYTPSEEAHMHFDNFSKRKPSKKFREDFGHTPLSVEEEIPWKCRQLVIGTGAYGRLPEKKPMRSST